MSTSPLSSGLRRHGPPACYRRDKDSSHSHLGPFSRCTKCRRVICPECIGKHLASGAVFCVECTRPVAVSDTLKLTFQLTAHDERLEVRATAPGGEGRAETAVPPRALLDQLAEHDPTNIPSSTLESVGKTLYQCLMVGDVAKLASDVLQDGVRLQQPVRLELRFDADQVSLAQYPWEMIADDLGQFLVREGLVDVTRYITYPQPPPAFDAMLHDVPLLRVISQPTKLPPITVIDLAVERIETLCHATFEQFLRKLLIERMAFWGLQFDGHGASILQCCKCDAVNALDALTCRKCGVPLSGAKQVGALAFERNGDVDWIPTEEFGSVLYNAGVRLALLLACETARVGNRLVFSGLAPSLILAGVPAVVGMQYPVLDDFANSFSNSFYTALLEQNDVLDALRTARRMNIRGAWYSPVLYLRHRKTVGTDEPVKSAYHTRNIDTAVPAEVQVGVNFLVRLWIRRPETRPLAQEQLREELDVPESVSISTREAEADVKFEPVERPVEGRKLRRGEVEVKLSSTRCDISPESIKLFVDEHLDAPPAIFTVRARKVGRAPLLFSVWQDGGQIVSVTHRIEVIDSNYQPMAIIETESHTVSVQDIVIEVLRPQEPAERLRQAIRFLVSGAAQRLGGLWAIFYGLVFTLARPFTSEAEERQIDLPWYKVLFLYVSGETLFSFVLVLILATLVIAVLGLLYAKANKIPHPRLLVAIAASATLWALLASELLYVFKKPLGKLTAQVFAHFVAFIIAILFGAWLVNQTAIDRLLNVFR